MPKSWMFKYKPRILDIMISRRLPITMYELIVEWISFHVSALPSCSRFEETRTCNIMRLLGYNQRRLNISFQMISLWASLFSMGDVLIDTKYLTIDLEVRKLTWLGLTCLTKRRLAEPWNEKEGMLLEDLKQLSIGDFIRSGDEDDEGLML